jgi:hypothetical protein
VPTFQDPAADAAEAQQAFARARARHPHHQPMMWPLPTDRTGILDYAHGERLHPWMSASEQHGNAGSESG